MHQPVIAAINGAAVGIRATMTLAMDARLMVDNARFGLVFGRLGIVPEAASTWPPGIVGLSKALDLVYRADILDSQTTADVGIADAVHEPENLLGKATELAASWTKDRSPIATALIRQMMRRNSSLPRPHDTHRIDAMFYTSIGDGAEGVAAFTEKRKLEFEGNASELPAFYEEWQEREH